MGQDKGWIHQPKFYFSQSFTEHSKLVAHTLTQRCHIALELRHIITELLKQAIEFLVGFIVQRTRINEEGTQILHKAPVRSLFSHQTLPMTFTDQSLHERLILGGDVV